MLNIPLWQWALYGVGAVFLVGAWVVLKKAERGAVWVVSQVLRRWGAESKAAAVVSVLGFAAVAGLFLWIGASWPVLLLSVAAFAIGQWGAARAGLGEAGKMVVGVSASIVAGVLIAAALPSGERGAGGVAGVGVSRHGGVAGVGAGLQVAGREEAGTVQGVQVETAARDSGQAACLCSAGASCVGPRGGVYCVSDAGSKRYLKGQ